MNKTTLWQIVPDFKDEYGLRKTAAKIFRDLGMRDYARIDFRTPKGTHVVLDVNSLPNLDRNRSYLPMAAEAYGWHYKDLIEAITWRVLNSNCPN